MTSVRSDLAEIQLIILRSGTRSLLETHLRLEVEPVDYLQISLDHPLRLDIFHYNVEQRVINNIKLKEVFGRPFDLICYQLQMVDEVIVHVSVLVDLKRTHLANDAWFRRLVLRFGRIYRVRFGDYLVFRFNNMIWSRLRWCGYNQLIIFNFIGPENEVEDLSCKLIYFAVNISTVEIRFNCSAYVIEEYGAFTTAKHDFEQKHHRQKSQARSDLILALFQVHELHLLFLQLAFKGCDLNDFVVGLPFNILKIFHLGHEVLIRSALNDF